MEYEYKEKGFIAKYRDNEFFDSLRADYGEFNNWYDKSINQETKTSHYWLENGKLKAFIGMKLEDEEIKLGSVNLPKSKRLKITTIKSKGIQGFSEFFVYQAIKRALQLKVKEVYFTVIPNNKEKQDLLEIAISYGFKVMGNTNKSQSGLERKSDEFYLMKTLGAPGDTWKETYPSLELETNPDFGIVVLMPGFHDDYIQDANLLGITKNQDFAKMGIQKAYVHRQKSLSKLSVGSVVLIYRKGPSGTAKYTSVITGVGRISLQYSKGIHYNTFDEFKNLVKKKHAFTTNETLKVWYEYGNYLTLFGLYHTFGEGKNVNLRYLESIGLNQDCAIYDRKPTKDQFIEIFKKGRGLDV